MLKKIFILSILFFSFLQLRADITVFSEGINVNAGDNFKVNIKVNGFIDVSTFQFVVKWDPTKFTYLSLGDLDALQLVENRDFNVFGSTGVIRTAWVHPESLSSDLVDGSTLFSINFNAICGSTTPVSITTDDNIQIVLFTDEFGDIIPSTTQNGNVTINGNPCGGQQSVLRAGNVSGTAGSQVCVPVTAGSGFSNITGLTATISIPSNCAVFNSTGNYNSLLSGLGSTSFDLSQSSNGIIRLQWTGAAGVSLSTGATVFEICYTPGEGCCDEIAPITFSNINFTTSGGGSNNLADNGGINVSCGDDCNPTGLAFIGSEVCGLTNTEVVVDVTAQGFQQMLGMQFSVDWDPAQLELVTDGIIIPANNLIPGFNQGKFGPVNDGCMRSLWDEATQTPITIPDGTLIFSLRFRILAPNGATAKVNFGGKCLDGGELFISNVGNVPFTGCSGTVRVQECSGLTINDGTISDASCHGECDGAISFTVVGAANPVITWSAGGLSGNSVSGLCAGSYTVTVTAGNETATKTYVIEEPDAIVINVASVTPSTAGNNGAIDLNVSGGSGGFGYNWNTGATSQDLSGLAVGTYTVTVTDNLTKCTSVQSITVTDGSQNLGVTIQALKYGDFDLSCFGECDGQLTAVPAGGTPPYTYKWSAGNATTQSISEVCAGNYTVTITDNAGASVNATYSILVPERISVDFDIKYPTDDVTSDGEIDVTAEGGNAPYTYAWTGAITSSSTSLVNLGVGTYNLLVTDASGCSATFTEFLTPGGKGCYEGIGAITPNGDGKNDRLIITCTASVNNKFSIFDRWGQLVYNTTNYNSNWEGVSNSGTELPDGGYYWVLELIKIDSSNEIHKGAVSIIRSLR